MPGSWFAGDAVSELAAAVAASSSLTDLDASGHALGVEGISALGTC